MLFNKSEHKHSSAELEDGKSHDSIAGAILWHSREFEDNDSSANFLCGIGVGYAFPDTPWHVTLKAEHISNGGIGGRNQSINGIGIAVGYLF
jgi:hypothetical protein